jgi:hypothetical protein
MVVGAMSAAEPVETQRSTATAPMPVASLAEAGKPGITEFDKLTASDPGHNGAADGPAAAPLNPRYRRVEVAPTKTSIYVGMVSLVLPPLERRQGEYSAPYEAKVFPFFFYNETGRLWIEFSDEQLRRLERGERVPFQGRAQRADGNEHRVAGTVTPTDVTSGKVKVRVFATRSMELIFNTTYRFTGE